MFLQSLLGWVDFAQPYVLGSKGAVWGDVKAKSLQKPTIYIPNPFDALEQWERERYYTLLKKLLDPELPRRHSASNPTREGTAVLLC